MLLKSIFSFVRVLSNIIKGGGGVYVKQKWGKLHRPAELFVTIKYRCYIETKVHGESHHINRT